MYHRVTPCPTSDTDMDLEKPFTYSPPIKPHAWTRYVPNITWSHVTTLLLVMNVVFFSLIACVVYKVTHLQWNQLLPQVTGTGTGTGTDLIEQIGSHLEHDWSPSVLLSLHTIYAAMVTHIQRVSWLHPDGSSSHLIWDVSTNNEFSFIYRDMHMSNKQQPHGAGARAAAAAHHPTELAVTGTATGTATATATSAFQLDTTPYHKFVVDVGAMDGLSGSNSYNFWSAGFSGVLVEPFARHVTRARENLQQYMSEGSDVHVAIENAAITHVDGPTKLYLYCDASATGSSLDPASNVHTQPCSSTEIMGITVSSLAAKHAIPHRFAVLSIDAEGVGHVVLQQFIQAGFRPQYIIYETSKGMQDKDKSLLYPLGYRLIRFLYNNNIWKKVYT